MASYIEGLYSTGGFTEETIGGYDAKYFDIYLSDSTITFYANRILGDATGEMGPFYYYQDGHNSNRYHNSWYADNLNFVDSSNPWFFCGVVAVMAFLQINSTSIGTLVFLTVTLVSV